MVRHPVVVMAALLGEQATRIQELTAVNAALTAKLATLEHLQSRNSRNSSMPPSGDDAPGKTPPPVTPKRAGKGRKRGKQPGAPGSHLEFRGKADVYENRFPEGACGCGADLKTATDLGVVDSYQQTDIPEVTVTVTQHDMHKVACGCGRHHTATRPDGARQGRVGYGPNLQAFAVYLMVVPEARRITELYTAAAAQLGSDKAPVRLAGLYALERLAQDNPTQRRTIVNLWCAYLRMPYTPPATPADDTTDEAATADVTADDPARDRDREHTQEGEVRRSVQQLLVTHLNSNPSKSATFWDDIDIDLTGGTYSAVWCPGRCGVSWA